MRVLVCGGRDYADEHAVLVALSGLPPGTVVVHGAARGADNLAERAAGSLGLVTEPHPADWERLGRRAGPVGNAEMLATGVDLVIAFPGGRGTADMVARARRAGVPVRLVG